MRPHRFHDDDHGHSPKEPTPDEMMAKVVGMGKAIDALVEHITTTVEKLKGLGMDPEDALRTAVKLHDAEFAFFDGGGHGGH
jgi:hypothetical protein